MSNNMPLYYIVQEEFDKFVKLNYRCPKGMFVPDSFACGETKKEASANYEKYKSEKKQKLTKTPVKKDNGLVQIKLSKSTITQGEMYARYGNIIRIDKIENGKVNFSTIPMEGGIYKSHWSPDSLTIDQFKEYADGFISSFSELPRIKSSMDIINTETLRDTFREYTSNGFDNINRYLTRPVDMDQDAKKDVKKSITLMDIAFKDAKYPEDGIVYSGLGRSASTMILNSICPNEECKKGAVFELKPFVSTSLDMQITSAFDDGGIVLKINVPKGSKALSMEYVSSFPHEKEILINRGSKFQIMGSKQVGMNLIIDVNLIN